MYKLQSIYPKQNQKQIVHESNKLCMLQIGKKATRNVKKKKKKVLSTLQETNWPWELDEEN